MSLGTTVGMTIILLLSMSWVAFAAPIELVRSSGTNHVIYHQADAPPSVAMAAMELQEYLYKVAGAKLAIVNDPHRPMICLGDNASARAIGLSTDHIPLEGFRIVTNGMNIYILGQDTLEDELTPQGGTSTGTRNGVYAFLEKFSGVRWLIPGDHGDYIPKVTDITISDTDFTDAPFFLNRRVPYTQERRPETKRWWARQRLGWNLYLQHSHNWRKSIPAALFDEHPDWFAERGGERVPPAGRYKLCTTNKGLIREFADTAIRFFDERPQASCFSLSPSDSAGWCECEECSALYERDPNGNLSVTPAILKFYNDVAKLVAKEHPDKLLAGYVYAQYVFPPEQAVKLEPNVFLVWAPSFDYGFTLFRPELQEQWEKLATQWTQVTENISYYDLPNCVHNEVGAPNPPGLKILRFLYPRLKQHKMKGVYVYGNAAWGHSGLMNYLLAKLAWDPDADVDAIFHEFCEKAYGAGAEEMKQFYWLLDAETERYFLENPEERYVLSTGRMRDVYARNFTELERLYSSAEGKIRDPDARARLDMLGDNLKILHWNLRQLDLLDDPATSTFYQSDSDFFKFLSSQRQSLALQPIFTTRKPSVVSMEHTVSLAGKIPNPDEVKSFLLRSDQHILIRPTGGKPVEVLFSNLKRRGKLVTYSVYNAKGKDVTIGVMTPGVPLTLDAQASEYYHLVINAGQASYHVEVNGAAWAVDGRFASRGLHLLGKVSPVYFEVPEGIGTFRLQIGATPPGETAVATLYAPDGRETAHFDCTAKPVDRQEITTRPGDTGFWKLVIERAEVGVVDDVWIMPGDELAGYFSFVPEQALSVK
jgi:hypothetical protein